MLIDIYNLQLFLPFTQWGIIIRVLFTSISITKLPIVNPRFAFFDKDKGKGKAS
jgi:hypothetical protein